MLVRGSSSPDLPRQRSCLPSYRRLAILKRSEGEGGDSIYLTIGDAYQTQTILKIQSFLHNIHPWSTTLMFN
ncbi:uncharacterized protein H6S33_012600 [Morchella sextelata]|uniref:uncharacterized protein n=1 Tax=Morchella sextelata TaxID=1174677 RepID=UPI001D036C71|nr:uncharacterized protein H6S33_012600 [Morchella sextelata]KAH0610054.1 hypothetical protein H6S33_012600 [Morchella sextelata]